jgi:PAS domain S-box-containing protein
MTCLPGNAMTDGNDKSGTRIGISERTDNTARKQAEEALLKAEALLKPGALQRAIFNSANFSSIATDAKGVIQIFNVGAERMLGYTAAEVMNKITPADISDSQEIIARAKELSVELGTQIKPGFEALVFKASRGIEDIYELTYIRKDGSRFPAVVSVTALRDAQDVIIGYLLIGTDNTARKQAEETLLKAGALQRAIFNSANFSSIATDAKGVIQFFNVGAERMLGYAAADVMNKITPADISDSQEVIARAKELSVELGTQITPGFEALVFKASRGIEDIYELTYIRKDGSRFPAVVSVTALRDAQDVIIGYLLIGTDNTARKRAEEALLKAGALQRAIFNSANFSSIATDTKGVIQIFNVGAEHMLGYAAADVMNKITPADISDPQEVIARAKELSVEFGTQITPGFEALVFKASRGIEDIYELTYIRKDGSRFPAAVSVTALRDAEDAIIGYLLIGTDNTARKRVEAEQEKLDQRLRDQQFYTRSLIESNIDALMTTDPSGIITDVNKQMEALTGCTRDELIGAPFKSHFTDPERAEAAIKLVLRQSKIADFELTACARDGKLTEVSYNATTFYDRNRTLQGVFAAARDVTERKRVEVELREAKATAESASLTKSEFVASMSHEIRTPLHAIIGYTEQLLDEELRPKQRRYAEHIQYAGSNLLAIVNDVLDFSQIEAGALELEVRAFSLEALIGNTASMVRGVAEKKGLKFRVLSDPKLPNMLLGDDSRLGQILLNLLSNAIKFTRKGHVTLAVQLEERTHDLENLRFSVSDTGVGISLKQRKHLFERFSQVDNTNQRRFGGTGLGLSISKQLIELMGGKIGLDSESGRGSTFWIKVPLPPAKDLPAVQFSEAASRKAVTPGRILVAEDLAINQELTRSILEGAGHQVDIVTNGTEAIAAVQAKTYDLVFMDIQMPIMDGTAATMKIRALDHPANKVPIVAMTANVLPQQVRSFKEAGMSDHIGKPMKRDDLLDKVNEWLPNRCSAEKLSENKLPPAHPFFDQQVFDDFQNLMGRKAAVTWLTRLGVQLDTIFSDDRMGKVDRGQLGHSAHDIVSYTGFLGFSELTQRCSELEEACKDGKNLLLSFKKARNASLAAREMINTLTE